MIVSRRFLSSHKSDVGDKDRHAAELLQWICFSLYLP